MVQLRLPPSGPTIVGNDVGDVLIWNGTEWEPGPVSGSSAPALRSQFENDQELNAETVQLIDGCDLTFTDVPVGAYVFVQAVLNLRGEGLAECFITPVVRYYPGGVETNFWEPGGLFWLGEGEGELSAQCLPVQCQTPPLAAPSATLRVTLSANGQGNVRSGHFQIELIRP